MIGSINRQLLSPIRSELPKITATEPIAKQNLSFQAMAITTASSNDYIYPSRNVLPESAWVSCLNISMVYKLMLTHLRFT